MNHWDYIYTENWFAWYPVKTDKGWRWWEVVERTQDDRPLVYQGLVPIITYRAL